MDCFLLGSGGMMPMPFRFLTALVVRVSGNNYLFDAGEGTQIGYKLAKPGLRALKLIAITHLHADHCLGIPGLLMLRAQMETPDALTIVGPPGIRQFVESVKNTLDFFINFQINFIEWSPASAPVAYTDAFIKLHWAPLDHSVFCLGYRLEEHSRPGKFYPELAQKLSIPQGPLWRKLQTGVSIQLNENEWIEPGQVLGPARPGRSISFVVDTRPHPNILALSQAVDIAFIEGMFSFEMANEAREKKHLTVTEAAQLGRDAGARQTVLVHLSPRFRDADRDEILAEARKINESVEMGQDLAFYSIGLS
jgi:ribonuclease Z